MRPAVVLALTLLACTNHAAVHTTSAKLANGKDPTTLQWPFEGRSALTIKLQRDLYDLCQNLPARFSWQKPDGTVEYQAQLAALATCLNHEGMADRRLLLVGNGMPTYADGMRHAHAIKTWLVGAGLDADRIDVSSWGTVQNVDVVVETGGPREF